jgi:formate hydrogenlyase subunit 6/NADH:ubiquinone oxidoreductase subunit I
MGIITKYAVDALMKTSHPEIDRKQCWNLHPHRSACTDCKDICPHGADIFTRPNLVKDWTACTDCGLCVAACRCRCIAPSSDQIIHDTSSADSNADTLWIGCERSARHNDLVRECISALAWETLAYLALNKKIVLDLTPCGECENDLCAEKLRATLTRLVEFLGEGLFNARFTLAYQAEDAPYQAKTISRREMFGQVTDRSKAGTKQLLRMLPGMEEADRGRALDFRLMLNHHIKQLKAVSAEPHRYGWYMPAINASCYGCGKCEKACRAGALKIETLADGTSRIVLTPWKCSECGFCVNACNTHAIDGMKLRQVTSLGPVSLYKFSMTKCVECGKPVASGSEDGLCSVCRIRKKSKQRQEEAAARARQRQAEREAQRAAQKAEKEAEKEAAQAAQTAAPEVPEAAVSDADAPVQN